MTSNDNRYMHFFWRKKKAIKKKKSQILVNIQAVLHTNNATVEHRTKKIKYLRSKSIQTEIQDISLLP